MKRNTTFLSSQWERASERGFCTVSETLQHICLGLALQTPPRAERPYIYHAPLMSLTLWIIPSIIKMTGIQTYYQKLQSIHNISPTGIRTFDFAYVIISALLWQVGDTKHKTHSHMLWVLRYLSVKCYLITVERQCCSKYVCHLSAFSWHNMKIKDGPGTAWMKLIVGLSHSSIAQCDRLATGK